MRVKETKHEIKYRMIAFKRIRYRVIYNIHWYNSEATY